MTKKVVLLESLGLVEVTLDSEARTINGVTLIRSGLSMNRRYYSPELLQQAVPMFEGCKAFADHMTSSERWERNERSIRDITGWYSGVRWEGGCLKGMRSFAGTEAGEDAWALASAVVGGSAPKNLAGLSIAVYAHAEEMEGKDEIGNGEPYLCITEILDVVSVDDVTLPAAGGKYGESLEPESFWSKGLSYDEWRDLRPEYLERLQVEMKEVRQTKALKEALGERDALRTQLQEAQTAQGTLNSTTTELETLRGLVAGLEASLRLEKYIGGLTLPKVTLESLRPLLKADTPDDWDAVVERKRRELQIQPAAKVPVPLGEGTPVPPRQIQKSSTPSFFAVESPEDFIQWHRQVTQGGQ